MHKPSTPACSVPQSWLLRLWRGLGWLAHPVLAAVLARRFGRSDPARLAQHLGRASLVRPKGPLIWFHAASLGETRAILPVVADVRRARPDLAVLITTATETGAAAVADVQGVLHQYLPVDTGPAVRRFLRHWHPDLAVFVEAELWPRLIDDCHRARIPLALVGARMSDRSARRWRRFGALMPAIFGRFQTITVADAAMADRLAALGAKGVVVGSLKHLADRLPVDAAMRKQVQSAIGTRPVWAAMSTHAGEEELVLTAHATLCRQHPDALLVLVPRHATRGDDLAALLQVRGLAFARRSAGQMPATGVPVWLADTMGEAGLWFDTCPVVFMGGSLVDRGGHNAYEPAAHGAAILHGPHVGNFAPLYAALDTAGGAGVVTDAATLADAVARLWSDSAARGQCVQAALQAVAAGGQDGKDATVQLILRMCPAP